MSGISTHILNTSTGKPAAGVSISLLSLKNTSWNNLAEGFTDKDGRITNLLADIKEREIGIYKLVFLTGDYFKDAGIRNFYPYVEIIFEIDSDDHYHIPLLISPFGYSTYRGS